MTVDSNVFAGAVVGLAQAEQRTEGRLRTVEGVGQIVVGIVAAHDGVIHVRASDGEPARAVAVLRLQGFQVTGSTGIFGGRSVAAGLLILNRVGTIRHIAIVAPLLIRLGFDVVVGHSVLVALLQQLLQGVVASRNVADLQRRNERHMRERFISGLIDHQVGIDRCFGLGFLAQLRILQRVLVHIRLMDECRAEDDADTDQEQNNGNNEQNLRPDLDTQQLIDRHIHSPSFFELLWEQGNGGKHTKSEPLVSTGLCGSLAAPF